MIDIIMTINSYILLTIQVTAGYPPTIWSANQSDSSDDNGDDDDDDDSEDHFYERPDVDSNSDDLTLYPIPRGGVQGFFSRFTSCPTSD